MPHGDYRTYLNRKRKRKKAAIVKRTEKRAGDLEIVWKDGDWRLHRYSEEAA